MQCWRCLCASISIVSSRLLSVCCGSGRSLGKGDRGRFWVCWVVVDEVIVFEVVVFPSVA